MMMVTEIILKIVLWCISDENVMRWKSDDRVGDTIMLMILMAMLAIMMMVSKEGNAI